MHKSLLAVTTTAIMVLLLVTACAEEDKQAATTEKMAAPAKVKAVEPDKKKAASAPTENKAAPKGTSKVAGMDAPIMSEPVDFSTPESAAKTLQAIKEQAGPRVARKIEAAMGYMLTYDLGVGRDEAKMYKKLNGKTPTQIIEMGTARR